MFFIKFCFLLLCFLQQGCTEEKPVEETQLSENEKIKSDWLLNKLLSQLPAHFSMDYLQQKIESGDLAAASKYMNVNLQTNPNNAYLHLMNGFIYDEMEKNGDGSRRELASVAYQTAYNIDPTNWLSAYLLGAYKMRNQDYVNAQKYLSDAVILNPNETEILYALAYTSYYLGDIQVAAACIEKAYQIKPEEIPIIRGMAIISAADGKFNKAHRALEKYIEKVGKEHQDVAFISSRIQDWQGAHERAMAEVQKTIKEKKLIARSSRKKLGKTKKVALDQKENSEDLSENLLGDLVSDLVDVPEEKKDQTFVEKKLEEEAKSPIPILFECYILRTDERNATSKGNNVMNYLSISLKPSSDNQISVDRNLSRTTTPSLPVTGNWTKTFGLLASPELVAYSLNIANASQQMIEEVARPVVVTVLGKPAVFSSGDIYSGAVPGATGASVSSFDTGTKVEILPTAFSEDGRIVLDITVTQSVFTAPPQTAKGIDGQMVGTVKSKLTSTLKAAFGQTILLGGLYQKINLFKKQGVPLLQDLPLIQYFFAQETTDDQINSMIALITVRRGGSLAEACNYNQQDIGPSTKDKLKKVGMMAIGEKPVLYHILRNLSASPLFADYRSGDLLKPFWGYDCSSLRKKISQLSSFLFF